MSDFSVNKRRCCVPGCEDRHSIRHRFPKYDDDLFNIWITSIKHPRMSSLSKEEIYRSYVVCERHFLERDIIPSSKKARGLNRKAVPVQHLPGIEDDPLQIVPPKKAKLTESSVINVAQPGTSGIKTGISSVINVSQPGTSGMKSGISPGYDILRAIRINPLHLELEQSKDEIICDSLPDKTSTNTELEKLAQPSQSQEQIPVDMLKKNPIILHSKAEYDNGSVLDSKNHREQDCSAKPHLAVKVSNPQLHDASEIEYGNFTSPKKSPSRSPSKSPKVLGSIIGRRRQAILKSVDVTRRSHLTPRCKVFYKKVVEYSKKTAKLQQKITNVQSRLNNAHQVAENFGRLADHVNAATFGFIMQQIRTQKLTPKARRFTLNEKILSLTLLKASGKGYRLLSKIFALPSRRTLTNLLNKFSIRPGINERIFNSLKQFVEKMNVADRTCILIFDEISLSTNIFYNQKDDVIEGLEDDGTQKKFLLADHANVFMLKGVARQWKQPIAFTFSSGPAKSNHLKTMIKEIITATQNINLEIVATICDQGAANRSAINALIEDTEQMLVQTCEENRNFGFLINGKEVVPLFDVPHLFKGIRNNLLTKDLHFHLRDGTENVAKWKHIEQFYLLDSSDNTRMCAKLTDAHIYPQHMNKMKVSYCTQVFSNQVGSLMKRISTWNIDSEYKLETDAGETADLILFLDELFDSLNSHTTTAPQSKPLKGGVSKKSDHSRYWRDCIKVLETMRFYCPKKKIFVNTPSVKNLIHTVKGFIYLTETLLNRNFKIILTRTFNQDALENFFGSIRSHGFRNTNPDASHFILAYKSLLINNLTSSHSPGANCEEDISTGTLDDLRCFLTGEEIAGVAPLESTENLELPAILERQKRSRVAECTVTYIAGFIARKCLKLSGNCTTCKNLITFSDTNMDVDFIEARQYKNSVLIKPGSYLRYAIGQSLSRLFYFIPRICNKFNIAKLLVALILRDINFDVLNCTQHKLSGSIAKLIVRTILFFWTKKINLIAKGKDKKFLNFMKKNPQNYQIDPMKVLAHNKFLKKRNRK